VKLRTNTDFLGRRALESAQTGLRKKALAGFTVDDRDIVLVGRETILRNGEPVGYLTSGGFGYTVGRNVGYGYVRNADGVTHDFLASGDYELVVAMQRTPARIHLGPLYDPEMKRIRA
jgi:glycine cleavage system aminomethyltransferase T